MADEQIISADDIGSLDDVLGAAKNEPLGITDEIVVEIKGPDPLVWGEGQLIDTNPVASNELAENQKGPDPVEWDPEHPRFTPGPVESS